VISVEKLVVGWSNNWLSESHQSNLSLVYSRLRAVIVDRGFFKHLPSCRGC